MLFSDIFLLGVVLMDVESVIVVAIYDKLSIINIRLILLIVFYYFIPSVVEVVRSSVVKVVKSSVVSVTGGNLLPRYKYLNNNIE